MRGRGGEGVSDSGGEAPLDSGEWRLTAAGGEERRREPWRWCRRRRRVGGTAAHGTFWSEGRGRLGLATPQDRFRNDEERVDCRLSSGCFFVVAVHGFFNVPSQGSVLLIWIRFKLE